MVTIVFMTHSTSAGNESGVASGHHDADLSERGRQQAHDVGERYRDAGFDAVFCSDLRRSHETAAIAFGDSLPIIKDPRLRECDYGDLTQHPVSEIESLRAEKVRVPFPGAESYEQVAERVHTFLDDLAREWDGKKVLVVGHRATQYALEQLVNGVPLEEAVTAPWSWQPGWTYVLTNLPTL